MIDLDMKIESSRLDFEELSEDEINFFLKAFDKTKNTNFWVPRKR